MLYAACVAIASLLDRREKEHYRIHCICNRKIMEREGQIAGIVNKRDSLSEILFYEEPNSFYESFEVRGISKSTYLRLCLHRILNHLDKVIYADVDVLFYEPLKGIWETKLNDQLLAGVKGANNFQDTWNVCMQRCYADELQGLKGKYINAGILLMNLKAIREMEPDETWKEMSRKQYHYQDQDILNITCRERIVYLDLCYNVAAHLVKKDFFRYEKEQLYNYEICERAWKKPIILHYTGEKPWNNRGTFRSKSWWDYVDSQPDLKCLFSKRKIKNKKNTGIIGKINRHLPW